MKDMKRAQRRHHEKRMKKKADRLYLNTHFCTTMRDEDHRKWWVVRVANNPTVCSCYMCGNPRKKIKGRKKSTLTFQEIKCLDYMKSEGY